MKKQFLIALLLISTSQAQAFSQETHKRIVIDAVNYMQQHTVFGIKPICPAK